MSGLDAEVVAQKIPDSTLDTVAMAGLRLGRQMIASERGSVVNATDADDQVRIRTAQAPNPYLTHRTTAVSSVSGGNVPPSVAMTFTPPSRMEPVAVPYR
jgi:hypothetical protein